jgi:hypothetical protein
MPDHWTYVMAAYGMAAAVLLGYWRYLERRAHAVQRGRRRGRA